MLQKFCDFRFEPKIKLSIQVKLFQILEINYMSAICLCKHRFLNQWFRTLCVYHPVHNGSPNSPIVLGNPSKWELSYSNSYCQPYKIGNLILNSLIGLCDPKVPQKMIAVHLFRTTAPERLLSKTN